MGLLLFLLRFRLTHAILSLVYKRQRTSQAKFEILLKRSNVDMSQTTAISRIEFKGLNVDLFTTGPAARMAGVDRRTFIAWANKLGIKPTATLEGNRAVYIKEDVQKISKAIKDNKK